MTPLSCDIRIEAPRDAVWASVTDFAGAQARLSQVTRLEIVGDPEFRPGFIWRETRKMHGREHTEEMRIAEIDAPARYVAVAEAPGARYRTEVALEQEGPHATRLFMRFSGEPRGALARLAAALLGPLMRGAVRKMMRTDLQDVKRAVENRR